MQPLAAHWTLDPKVTFLNHGSFGACPRVVREAQDEFRARLEREPVRFFVRDLEPLLDHVREVVSGFVNAAPEDLAFVPNATTGANAVLGSLGFEPGDEVLCTSHGYHAVSNTLLALAERTGARIVVADVPFPLTHDDQIVDALVAKVSRRTKLCVVDHITSPTGLVFPIARIVEEMESRGIDTLVDAAHAPGQVPIDLTALNAAYYTGNFHKWVCAPKGAAMLHVRRDRKARIHPSIVSHGRDAVRKNRSRFQLEFDWTGTTDPTAVLSVPAALSFLASALPGGFSAVYARNHALALEARRLLADRLGLALPCPDHMVGFMAALVLPAASHMKSSEGGFVYELQDRLVDEFGIQVPIMPWPRTPERLLRISAQLYNERSQYEHLAQALSSLLG